MRRSGTMSRGTVLFILFAHAQLPKTEALNTFVEKLSAQVELNTRRCKRHHFLLEALSSP